MYKNITFCFPWHLTREVGLPRGDWFICSNVDIYVFSSWNPCPSCKLFLMPYTALVSVWPSPCTSCCSGVILPEWCVIVWSQLYCNISPDCEVWIAATEQLCLGLMAWTLPCLLELEESSLRPPLNIRRCPVIVVLACEGLPVSLPAHPFWIVLLEMSPLWLPPRW